MKTTITSLSFIACFCFLIAQSTEKSFAQATQTTDFQEYQRQQLQKYQSKWDEMVRKQNQAHPGTYNTGQDNQRQTLPGSPSHYDPMIDMRKQRNEARVNNMPPPKPAPNYVLRRGSGAQEVDAFCIPGVEQRAFGPLDVHRL